MAFRLDCRVGEPVFRGSFERGCGHPSAAPLSLRDDRDSAEPASGCKLLALRSTTATHRCFSPSAGALELAAESIPWCLAPLSNSKLRTAFRRSPVRFRSAPSAVPYYSSSTRTRLRSWKSKEKSVISDTAFIAIPVTWPSSTMNVTKASAFNDRSGQIATNRSPS